jgi:phosphatidylserine/phosphatidylglycerophosphate/cardiolipin synthase-like enzyme
MAAPAELTKIRASHGKMLLVDDRAAVIGSISLSPPALNVRREVAAVLRDAANVAELKRFFETRGTPGGGIGLNEWSVPDRIVEHDDAEDSD